MIQLDENYLIETDSYNWTLRFESVRMELKDGKEKQIKSKDEWHYPNIKLCLKKYLDESLKDCPSIEDVLIRIGELEKKIDKLNVNHFQNR